MTQARRAVIDTNTVLSALLFARGRLVPLRAAWQAGTLVPLLCAQTVEELLRVLAYPKFKLTHEEIEELLSDYLPFGEVITAWRKRPEVPTCRDKHDQVFLELASVGAAHWLVTGDQDLLSLAGQVKFQIMAPAAVIDLLSPTK